MPTTDKILVDTVSIRSIFEDPREHVFDSDISHTSAPDFQCPEIEIKIENVKLKVLIDTGSKISCVSEAFYQKHMSQFSKCPKIPLPSIVAIGFNGKKSEKLRLQIFPKVSFNTLDVDLVLIMVPKLIKNCILGIDALAKIKAVINIKDNFVHITYDKNHGKIEFTYKNSSESDRRTINELISCSSQVVKTDVGFLEESQTVDYVPTETDIKQRIDLTHGLDQHQKDLLKNLRVKYRDVFTDCPGRIKNFEYKFEIKTEKSYVKKPYPIPLKYRERMRGVIDRMLRQDIIEKSNITYINSLALTLKKNGSIRTNLDARELNEMIEADHTGPETMEEILAQCEGVKYISSLDLVMSFWQVKLAEDCKKYTAFKIFGEVTNSKLFLLELKLVERLYKEPLIKHLAT